MAIGLHRGTIVGPLVTHASDELFATRSALSPDDAVERLGRLGTLAALPTSHRELLEVEVSLGSDLLAPVLDVQIETRRQGSYVTARVATSHFLLDFARFVRVGLTLYAVAILAFACARLEGASLGRALYGVSVGWVASLSLATIAVRLVVQRGERELPRARLRHQLARLICR